MKPEVCEARRAGITASQLWRLAVVGGNAVAAWVATRDEGAIRNTQDVDILLRPEDFESAKTAFAAVGFVADEVMDVTIFLDGPDGKPSQGVHVLWAGQKVRDNHVSATPTPSSQDEPVPSFV